MRTNAELAFHCYPYTGATRSRHVMLRFISGGVDCGLVRREELHAFTSKEEQTQLIALRVGQRLDIEGAPGFDSLTLIRVK